MTHRQYCQLLQNRRRTVVAPLFSSAADARLVRLAVQQARRCERARRALAGVLPVEWLAVTTVEALEGGTLVLVVSDGLVREQLGRQALRLQRELSRRVPGVRRLRVSPAGGAG